MHQIADAPNQHSVLVLWLLDLQDSAQVNRRRSDLTREMAIPGTHDLVMGVLSQETPMTNQTHVLDIGAGEGALSERLKKAGASVTACDYAPEQFKAQGIECRKCDKSGTLPFPDGQFDLAVAVEVLEHIDGHAGFFHEVARILKPGGLFLFTTPNILSLKSRIQFLFTGSFYSFGLLEPFTDDPIHQHISPFTMNRYAWMLSQHGLSIHRVATDKVQTSSLLLSLLVPFIRLASLGQGRNTGLFQKQNSWLLLSGRKLVIVARKAL